MNTKKSGTQMPMAVFWPAVSAPGSRVSPVCSSRRGGSCVVPVGFAGDGGRDVGVNGSRKGVVSMITVVEGLVESFDEVLSLVVIGAGGIVIITLVERRVDSVVITGVVERCVDSVVVTGVVERTVTMGLVDCVTFVVVDASRETVEVR